MSVMLASDDANPAFVGAHNPDAALVVKFHTKPVQQTFRTSQENRPIFEDVDFIKIFTPGNQLNIIDTPVRDEHKRRFPVQWAAFQNGKGGDQVHGTPVSAWSFLTASQAEEFKAVKFFTVEQVANASDQQLQSLGMIGGTNPHVIRDRAKAYLAAAAGTAIPQAQAHENAELKAQLAAVQAQVAALLAATNGMTPVTQPAAPSKRARRTKAQMAADNNTPPAPIEPAAQPQEQTAI